MKGFELRKYDFSHDTDEWNRIVMWWIEGFSVELGIWSFPVGVSTDKYNNLLLSWTYQRNFVFSDEDAAIIPQKDIVFPIRVGALGY